MQQLARDAKNTDEFFQRIHDAVPGFAGLTFEDGIPTVYLVEPARSDLARSVLEPFFTARGRTGFRVREAAYSWQQLYDWRRRARQMFDMPDLRSISVSASKNRLQIGIRIGGDAEGVLARLQELGVDPLAVHVQEEPNVQLMVGLGDRHRPVMGGLMIRSGSEPENWCTHGANVLWGDTLRTYLTADHCGTMRYQATYASGNLIGGSTVVNSSSHSCEDQQHYNCHHSDARLITFEDSVDWSFGHIAHPLYSAQWSGSTNFENRFWIKDSYYLAAEDDTVHKVGATTGWTTGLITDACTDQLSEGVWKICQVEVAAGAGGGDSGSPVFTRLSYGNVNMAGVLWGGWPDSVYFYSPMSNIEEDFGAYVDVITDSTPALPSGVTISGPTEIRPGATCLWQGSTSGGTTPFTYLWENDTHDVSQTDSYEGGMLPGGSGSSFVLRFTVSNDAGQSYDQITLTEDSNAPICVI